MELQKKEEEEERIRKEEEEKRRKEKEDKKKKMMDEGTYKTRKERERESGRLACECHDARLSDI